jgi:hypothetical protein
MKSASMNPMTPMNNRGLDLDVMRLIFNQKKLDRQMFF